MQVHQHALLKRCLAVADADAVVVPVQAVNQGLDGRFVEVAKVGRRLPRFLAQHERLWVDEAKGVDDDLALDGLDGVDDDGDGARCELLKGLLRVDVDAGQPAAEPGMGVVPANNCLGSAKEGQQSSCGNALGEK